MRNEKPLSDKLKFWRAERPDEWTMDEFIRDATRLEGLVTDYLTELSNLHDEIEKLKFPPIICTTINNPNN